MRSRPADDRVTELTRRRLAALAAELAAARGEHPPPALDTGSGARASREQRAAVGEAGTAQPEPAAPGRHARRPASWRTRVVGWAGDRVPEVLASRPHLGSAQAAMVLVIVAAGLVLSAWWLLRAGGSPAGVAAPARPDVVASVTSTSPATPAPPAPAGPAVTGGSVAAASTADPAGLPNAGGGQIVVDVAGKVRRPGIAVLAAGSRVVDAVRAAGGLRPGVDRTTINFARPLTDGEQVLVGAGPTGGGGLGATTASSAAPSAAPAAPGSLVNINTADQTALETLPDVGPVTAQAILQWRTEHGGFTSVDELLEVSGIGDATLAKIAPYVTL